MDDSQGQDEGRWLRRWVLVNALAWAGGLALAVALLLVALPVALLTGCGLVWLVIPAAGALLGGCCIKRSPWNGSSSLGPDRVQAPARASYCCRSALRFPFG